MYEDQPDNTFRLYRWENGSNGVTNDIGIYRSYRTCVEVARALYREDPTKGAFGATFLRSQKRFGAGIDGYSTTVPTDPPVYTPDLEIRLKDGRTVWLGDVEDSLI